MPDREKSLNNLQTALSMELAAVHQYLLHAHVLDGWGLDRLAVKMREEMNEELGHAQMYIERIMFLKGAPVVQAAKTPQLASSLENMFNADLKDEQDAIAFYTKAAQTASEHGDIGTRTLFEQVALDEEGHFAWLELQLDLLGRMGEPAFIGKHMSVSGGEGQQ